MRWNERIIGDEQLSRYRTNQTGSGLVSRVNALLAEQRETWPLLRENYESFSRIETKRVRVCETEVVVQHNPNRIRSTAAAVDKESINGRRCFLCPENIPPEEKGIEYGDDLIILCNPYPVLNKHLSIVHRKHIGQRISGNVERLLMLARDLSPEFFALYNGPECGASAPDHLHFQACSRELLPIEEELRADDPVMIEDCTSCADTAREIFEVFTLSGCGRSVIVIRGGNGEELAAWIYRALDELARASGKAEAMINIICTHANGVWNVYLFPRSKHRPLCFYAEGNKQLIVSPGAIDMAGVIITPQREHFLKIDSADIERIFAEVSLSEDSVNEIVERVCEQAGEGVL